MWQTRAPHQAGLLLLTVLLSGCSTYAHRVEEIRHAYYRNDLSGASELIEEGLKRHRDDDDVLRLESAMVLLTQGRPGEAEVELRNVRDHFDELEGLDAREVTLSYWTDDQRRAYSGEDYERVLVRAFLALSNLLYDGSDAEAYSLQAMEKQEQIIGAGGDTQENLKRDYPRVALAPYLRGVLREATHRDFEDAGHAYASVVSWRPEFAAGQVDLQRTQFGRHSRPGNGVLYVFALTGRGPYKQEVVEVPSSAALLFAGEIVSELAAQTVPPNVAPVKVPRVIARPNSIRSVAVSINGRHAGETSTITDVTSLAVAQNEAIFPQIVARAVARRLLKKGVVYTAKEAADLPKGSLPGLAVDIVGVAWEAAEAADTRCWGLLPDRIQVVRIELPAGDHDVQLLPVFRSAPMSEAAVHRRVPVRDGRNTYVLAVFPDKHLVGDVVVSHP
jgi:hypothetical protein